MNNLFNVHEGEGFSLSISDIMSGLLLIFILLLSSVLLEMTEQKEKNEYTLNMVSDQEKAKRSIISELSGELDEFDLEVDEKTGIVRIKESLLFEYGKSDVTDRGKGFLKIFIPKYAEILLCKHEIEEQIGNIIIEGHTDNIGSYNYNLDLSLMRAFSVANYIYSDQFDDFEYSQSFQNKLSANGRSYINPLVENDTDEHRQQNRRVEFKFSFKDWTLIENDLSIRTE